MTMIFNGLFLICIVLAPVSILTDAEDEIPCQKINFNTADKGNIEKCPSITQQLTKKEYANSRYIKPFRKDAKYYLSNQKSKISCEQTKETFRMDQNSLVQMTNFRYLSQDASLSVVVTNLDDLDENGNAKVVLEWQLFSGTQEWEVFNETIDRNIARAKVQIKCNLNDLSTFAIEHLHVINSAIDDDVCQEEVWYPDLTTTTVSTTTSSTTQTSSTTTEVSSTSTSSTEEVTSSTEGSSTTAETESTTEETSTTVSSTQSSSTTETQSSSTTEEITTNTEEEVSSTIETSTSEITSTEDPSSTSHETPTSTAETSTDTETPTIETSTGTNTPQISTEETSTNAETTPITSFSSTPSTSTDDPDYNMLYLYLILSTAAASIMLGLVIFIVIICKSTGFYQTKTTTSESNTGPKPMNNESTSSLSDFSITSDKSLEGIVPTNQIPRINGKRNDSGLSSHSTAILIS